MEQYYDEDDEQGFNACLCGTKKINKKNLKEIRDILIKIDPAIKQIMHIKPNGNMFYIHTLIIIVQTQELYEEHEILRKIVSKLSDYQINAFIFNENERIPIKLLSLFATKSCSIIYAEEFRKYTLTKDILKFKMEEANKKLSVAEKVYDNRFEPVNNVSEMSFIDNEVNACSNIRNAFGCLLSGAEQVYELYKEIVDENDALTKIYKAVKYHCSSKYNNGYYAFYQLYTISELEEGFETTRCMTESFINKVSSELNKIFKA